MATFGKTTDGGSTPSSSGATKAAVSAAAPSTSGVVQTGHAQLSIASGTTQVCFAIYTDAGGQPGDLVGQSDSITLSETAQTWKTFPFSSPITVEAGTTYWIGPVWDGDGTGGNVSGGRDGDANGRWEVEDFVFPTLPDPFSSGGNPRPLSGPMAAYVTYTEGSAPGSPIVDAGPDATVEVGELFQRIAEVDDNGSAVTSVRWEIIDGPTGIGDGIDETGFSFTPPQVGQYTFEFRATNEFGPSTDSMVITAVPAGGGDPGEPIYASEFTDGTPYPTITGGTNPVSASSLSAVASAANGSRVTLAPGSYSGTLNLSGKSNLTVIATGVTLTSGAVSIEDCTNVIFQGMTFAYDQPGDQLEIRGSSQRVQITRCRFGPATHPGSASAGDPGNFVYVADDCQLIRIDHNELRNKSRAGNGIRIYGNFSTNVGCRYVRIDHNYIHDFYPAAVNDFEPIRYGVSQMSRTNTMGVIERNVIRNIRSEPEVISIKMSRIRCSGNVLLQCAGGPVIRHGTGSIMSDNYVIDEQNTQNDNGELSGGPRFYDADHTVEYNLMQGLAGDDFQASVLLDTGDAENSGDELNAHWRVVRATVRRNVIVESQTPIQVGDNYSLVPSNCTVTDNLVAATASAAVLFQGGITAGQIGTVSNNQWFSTAAGASLTKDSDGVYRRDGWGPRVTYLGPSNVGPSADLDDSDGTGAPLVPLVKHRFYLTNTAATYVPGTTANPDWSDRAAALASPRLLGPEPAGTNVALQLTETVATSPWRLLVGQWVSHPAAVAGSMTGGYDLTVGIQQSDAAAQFYVAIAAWIVSPTGESRGLSWWYRFSGTTSLTPFGGWMAVSDVDEVEIQPGDRVVVEIGYRAENTDTDPHTGTIWAGGTATTDLAREDTGSAITSRPGWIDIYFSEGMAFEPGVNATPGTAQGSGAAGAPAGAARVATSGAAGGGAAAAVGVQVSAAAGLASGSGSAGAVLGARSVAAIADTATAVGDAAAVAGLEAVSGLLGAATSSGTAGELHSAVEIAAGPASGSASAELLNPDVRPLAGAATGAGTAVAVTAIEESTQPVGLADASGAAGPVQARVRSNLAEAPGTGSAGPAGGSSAPGTSTAGGTASGSTVAAVVAAQLGEAAGVGTASEVFNTREVAPTAEAAEGQAAGIAVGARAAAAVSVAQGSGSAGHLTATASPSTFAHAAAAAAIGAADGLGGAVWAPVGTATGYGHTGDVTTAGRPIADTATGTAEAGPVVAATRVLRDLSSASGTGSAGGVRARITGSPITAAAAGSAPSPAASSRVGLGSAAATGAAVAAVADVASSPAGSAEASASAGPLSAGLAARAGGSEGAGTATPPVATVAAPPGAAQAHGAAAAAAADTRVFGVVDTATGTGQAAGASATAIAVRDALASTATGAGTATQAGAEVRPLLDTATATGSAQAASGRVSSPAGGAAADGSAGRARGTVAAPAPSGAGVGTAGTLHGDVLVPRVPGTAGAAGHATPVAATATSTPLDAAGTGEAPTAAGAVSACLGTATGFGSASGGDVELMAAVAAALADAVADEVRGPGSWEPPYQVRARRLDDMSAVPVDGQLAVVAAP